MALLNVGFLGAVIAVTLLAMHGKLRITFVGLICVGMATIVYGSPLSALVHIHHFNLIPKKIIIYGNYNYKLT